MKIIYDSGFNKTILAEVQARLDPYFKYFPRWCQHLGVAYDVENPAGASLACQTNYHYRSAQLIIFPTFMDDPDWEASIVHELLHVYQEAYVGKVETILQFVDVPEGLREYWLQELTKESEAVTQDLALLFSQLVSKNLTDFDQIAIIDISNRVKKPVSHDEEAKDSN